MVRYPEQKKTIKHQELSNCFLFPSTRSNSILHLTLSPILHLMIPNVANSTSIMHAKPRLSLQWLNLTTSRSFDVIAGRCGGQEAWTTPPCKGYLWYTDPGAPASCRVHARCRYSAENIQSDVCVEITVSCGAMTIEVSQSVNQRNRKRGENKKDLAFFSFSFFFSFFETSFLLTSPAHILIITVSVQLDLLSACNFCQRAQQRDHHLSTNAQWLPCL